MSIQTLNVPRFDPNNIVTGPARLNAGVARMGAVTPGTQYGEYARWLYIGTTGTLSIVAWDGTTQALTGISAGVWHPIYSIMVNTAGTTATGMLWGS